MLNENKMTRILTSTFAVVGTALMLTGAAQQPPTFAQAQPGMWEISGAPGSKAPIRQCVGDVATLARFEHRSKSCSTRVLKNAGSTTAIEYTCGPADFGHTEIQMLTPRSARISTQGISDGLPFNYVLQAHRLDECPKNDLAAHH
jgi:hypothetical protein